MNHAIVRIFDVYDHAQSARDALLAAGFEPASVSISIADEENGAVEANFTVGNEPAESAHHTFGSNYEAARCTGECIVAVATGDDAAAAKAAGILARFGARDAGSAAGGSG